ncbi:hypothetical protein MBBAR_30c00020 [Methanobrevibacter arboriphilus JCM 13429 = DSM 1125]|uniref:HEPN domain-containing protein n=1 Tax=Methanobrevibacter arboriphilus JCM 13429 = DSM 1125 TaxID=1300164 RepID=A0A1V6N059_METAZ|nr:HEPN domain-containing protein [Methanobrevibacter arboriphilus]OQD58002.1 hypothetical protein MBBAR_30c00020 [Methanobrevibacter arboriphilus JCM 13429 = DSM 1125]
MAFDEVEMEFNIANEKISHALILFENEAYNSVVILAYYAMFHAARGILAKKNIYPKTHKGITHQLGHEYIHIMDFNQDIYNLFIRSQHDRYDADYELYIVFTEEDADQSIKNAKIFIDECKRFL